MRCGKKVCPNCKREFVANHPTQKFCKDQTCIDDRHHKAGVRFRRQHPDYDKEWRGKNRDRVQINQQRRQERRKSWRKE